MEIANFESLFPTDFYTGCKLVRFEQERLLANGENYGSVILKLKVYLRTSSGEEKVVNCVAKLPPPKGFLWKAFNIPCTFKKEIIFYKTIIPALRAFGNENGVRDLLPFFPNFFGSRLTLNPRSEDVESDAVLLLENLLQDGYIVCNRFEGFDEDTTRLVLGDLAIMHATVIAYKLKKPEQFKEEIYPWIHKRTLFDLSQEHIAICADGIRSTLTPQPSCATYIDKVTSKIADLPNLEKNITYREPFATLVHTDFWINNIMIKFKNGKPISSKLLDFQLWDYGSPVEDVLFFLYTSTKLNLLTKLDEFLDFYFLQFTNTLEKLGCDKTIFGKPLFIDEIKIASNYQFVHILFMMQIIFTQINAGKDLADVKTSSDFEAPEGGLHENYYEKLYFLVEDFAKRGWL